MNRTRNPIQAAAAFRALQALEWDYETVYAMEAKLYAELGIGGEDPYALLLLELKSATVHDCIAALYMREGKRFQAFLGAYLGEEFSPPAKGAYVIKGTELKVAILKKGVFVGYIEYPSASWEEAEADLEKALHLAPLRALDETFEQGSVVIIRAQDKAMALDAAAYAAANLKSRHDDDWERVIRAEEDADDEEETGSVNFDYRNWMPILSSLELQSSYPSSERQDSVFSFHGMEGVKGGGWEKPYWEASPKCPLCVLLGEGTVDEHLLSSLKHLSWHAYLILVVVDREKSDVGIKLVNWQNAADRSDELAAELEFLYAIDAIKVPSPEVGDGYYEALLEDAVLAHKRDIMYSDGFTPKQLLGRIKAYRSRVDYATIERVVANAAQRKKSAGPLVAADFGFMERGIQAKKRSGKQEAAREMLDSVIVGQKTAKQQVLQAVQAVKLNARRIEAGLPDIGVHLAFMFVGAPGTAKTTMAKILAKLFQEEHLLNGDRFVSLSGAQLKAPYLGQTAHQVRSIFENHDIIFIDEAYSIVSDERINDSYAQEALAQLCILLEEYCSKKLVIFAGYGGDVTEKNNKMKAFMQSNPGISSRISHIIDFESYDPCTDMMDILLRLAENLQFTLEDGAIRHAADYFRIRAKQKDFGNGRDARRLLERAISLRAKTLDEGGNYGIDEMTLLSAEDVAGAAEELLRGFAALEGCREQEIEDRIRVRAIECRFPAISRL